MGHVADTRLSLLLGGNVLVDGNKMAYLPLRIQKRGNGLIYGVKASILMPVNNFPAPDFSGKYFLPDLLVVIGLMLS